MVEEKFSDEVKKKINYNREILIKFPNEVYKDFREYANDNAGKCYWLAIKNLLIDHKSKTIYNMLIERVIRLERKVAEMLAPAEPIPEPREEPQTFGKDDKGE